jgi:uncharacterized membrane protein YphA (DoxX/SURF4 family)
LNPLLRRWLPLIGRLGLAVMFLYSGYAKIREPWLQFAISVDSFKVVPDSWLEPIARTLPPCEILLGIALLSGLFPRFLTLYSTLLLSLFLSVGIRASVLGLTVDCGCFGPGASGRIDAIWFLEHGAMVAGSLLVTILYFMKSRQLAIPHAPTLSAVKQ